MNALMNYIQLTKPRIMLLIVASGAIAIFMEGSLRDQPGQIFILLTAIFLTGGSANAMNQFIERDIDARMSRTKHKRVLVQGRISAMNAMVFALGIGSAGLLILGIEFNWYAAAISLCSILYYTVFYTLWLKPHTDQNVVIGGVCGALVPVGAWMAAAGNVSLTPWILFLIIFFWTPPHFWALALLYKDDYIESGLTMMPIQRGDRATIRQILIYSWLLVLTSFSLCLGQAGSVYFISSAGLGSLFLVKAYRLKRHPDPEDFRALFRYSILYLFTLFAAIVVDDWIS